MSLEVAVTEEMIKMNCIFETLYHKIFQNKLTGSIQKIVLNLTYQAHFENNARVVTLIYIIIYSFLILEKKTLHKFERTNDCFCSNLLGSTLFPLCCITDNSPLCLV